MKSKIVLEMELVEHGKVVLTSPTTDTYTSRSEDLIDFLHGARMFAQSAESTPPEGKGYSLEDMEKLLQDAEKLLCRAYGFNHEDMGWDVDFEDWKELYTKINIASLPSPPVKDDWVSVEDESMPLETDIIVKHPFGVEAIHFLNANWRFWYTGNVCDNDLLKGITHFKIIK